MAIWVGQDGTLNDSDGDGAAAATAITQEEAQLTLSQQQKQQQLLAAQAAQLQAQQAAQLAQQQLAAQAAMPVDQSAMAMPPMMPPMQTWQPPPQQLHPHFHPQFQPQFQQQRFPHGAIGRYLRGLGGARRPGGGRMHYPGGGGSGARRCVSHEKCIPAGQWHPGSFLPQCDAMGRGPCQRYVTSGGFAGEVDTYDTSYDAFGFPIYIVPEANVFYDDEYEFDEYGNVVVAGDDDGSGGDDGADAGGGGDDAGAGDSADASGGDADAGDAGDDGGSGSEVDVTTIDESTQPFVEQTIIDQPSFVEEVVTRPSGGIISQFVERFRRPRRGIVREEERFISRRPPMVREERLVSRAPMVFACPPGTRRDRFGRCVKDTRAAYVWELEILRLHPEFIRMHPELRLHPELLFRLHPEFRTRFASLRPLMREHERGREHGGREHEHAHGQREHEHHEHEHAHARDPHAQPPHGAPPGSPAAPGTPAPGAPHHGHHGQHGAQPPAQGTPSQPQGQPPTQGQPPQPPPPHGASGEYVGWMYPFTDWDGMQFENGAGQYGVYTITQPWYPAEEPANYYPPIYENNPEMDAQEDAMNDLEGAAFNTAQAAQEAYEAMHGQANAGGPPYFVGQTLVEEVVTQEPVLVDQPVYYYQPVVDWDSCPDGYTLDDWGQCVPEVTGVFVIEREILFLYPELIIQYPELRLHPERVYTFRPELRARYAGVKSVADLRSRYQQVHHKAPPPRPKSAPPAGGAGRGAPGHGAPGTPPPPRGAGKHGAASQQPPAQPPTQPAMHGPATPPTQQPPPMQQASASPPSPPPPTQTQPPASPPPTAPHGHGGSHAAGWDLPFTDWDGNLLTAEHPFHMDQPWPESFGGPVSTGWGWAEPYTDMFGNNYDMWPGGWPDPSTTMAGAPDVSTGWGWIEPYTDMNGNFYDMWPGGWPDPSTTMAGWQEPFTDLGGHLLQGPGQYGVFTVNDPYDHRNWDNVDLERLNPEDNRSYFFLGQDSDGGGADWGKILGTAASAIGKAVSSDGGGGSSGGGGGSDISSQLSSLFGDSKGSSGSSGSGSGSSGGGSDWGSALGSIASAAAKVAVPAIAKAVQSGQQQSSSAPPAQDAPAHPSARTHTQTPRSTLMRQVNTLAKKYGVSHPGRGGLGRTPAASSSDGKASLDQIQNFASQVAHPGDAHQ